MFRRESEFKISEQPDASAEGQPRSELEELRARWYSALEEGYQSHRLKVFKLNQDGRERLFYVLTQDNTVDSLKTTVKARTLRDDLSVFDLQLTYTQIPNTGVKQEVTFHLIPDPKAVGVDPLETVRLVDRIINGRNP